MNIKAFFLQNSGIRQTIVKNTFWLIVAESFSRFLEAVLVVYIVRVLGAAQFGAFVFAVAVASLVVSLSSLGLSEIMTREIAYDKKAEQEYSAVLSFRVILGVLVFFFVIVVSFFITNDSLSRLIIVAFTVFYFLNDLFSIIYAFLRAHQKMEYEAGFKILRSLILMMVVFSVIFKAPSVQNISYAYLFANVLALTLVVVFFHIKVYPLKLNFDIVIWKKFFMLSWPLGLAAVSGAIFINIDSVIMGHLGQVLDNGWYGAARKAVGIIIIPATLIFMSFYPAVSRLFKESAIELQRTWDHYMALMIFFAFPITAGGVIVAPKLMIFVYGSSFGPSIFLFQILIFIAGINFLYYPYALILITSGQQRKYLWTHLVGAMVNIFLNVMLIPKYGALGAAVSAVTTFAVLLAMAVVFSQYFTPISVFSRQLLAFTMIVVVASFVMSAIILQSLIYRGNIFYVVVSGVIVYIFVFLLSYRILKKYNFLPNFLNIVVGGVTIL